MAAKLFNLQPKQITGSQYIQEVDQLLRASQAAHKTKSAPQEYAEELSLQVVVKSIVINSTIDEVGSQWKSGNFNSMNASLLSSL